MELWRIFALFVYLIFGALAAFGDEVYVPSTPVSSADDIVTGYHVSEFGFVVPLGDTQGARVDVTIIGTKAPGVCAMTSQRRCNQITASYTGEAAVTLINNLNTANLSANSLRRRIIVKLQTDGTLPAGAISGSAGVPTPLPTQPGGM